MLHKILPIIKDLGFILLMSIMIMGSVLISEIILVENYSDKDYVKLGDLEEVVIQKMLFEGASVNDE